MLEYRAIVIPAYNPHEELLSYLAELKEQGIETIIIVDDGSGKDAEHVFSEIKKDSGYTLLTHPVNQGKGRAMKTAFRYIKEQKPEIRLIVTADADGQHAVKDVAALFEYLENGYEGIVLGSRNFDEEHVPKKNAFGNRLTSKVFRLLFGKKIEDTQTGLRGFSVQELEWLIPLKGERFEYEMNMLIYAVHAGIPLHEVPIQTLYFGKKPATHYKVMRDSYQIARQLAVGSIIKQNLVEESAAKGGE